VNARERFLEVALFGNPDKIPIALGDIRPATRKAWISQGLQEKANVLEFLNCKACCIGSLNITSYPSEGFEWTPNPSAVNIGPMPPFDYRIIREDERYRVWVDSLGVTQQGFQEDWKYGWSGFATRVFMDFPVKNGNDFVEIKKRYDPKDPRRYGRGWNKTVRTNRKREYPLCAMIRGPFWWTRDMMGLNRIATGIYKEPELIREIMDFCGEFQVQALGRAFEELEVDYVILNEDMGHKGGPMIGPKTMKAFMGQAYGELARFFKGHGVKTIIVDSDGNIEPLIPVWEEFGINGISPCEAAAGMDVVRLREKYPRLVMVGGIDKRKLSQGKEAIDEEVLHKVPALVETGGYFPGVDHAVPPDIALDDFRYYVSLLKKICMWSE